MPESLEWSTVLEKVREALRKALEETEARARRFEEQAAASAAASQLLGRARQAPPHPDAQPQLNEARARTAEVEAELARAEEEIGRWRVKAGELVQQSHIMTSPH